MTEKPQRRNRGADASLTRRVVLVVKGRADDAARDRFFLVTLIEWTRKLRHEVPAPNLPAKGAANAARPRATWAR